MKTDYFSELLVGAEDWAIDQIREDYNNLAERYRDLQYLKLLVGQLLYMLEYVETSDNETDFHPTVIRTCRVNDSMKLAQIMPKITQIVRGENPKKYKDFTKEEIDEILSKPHYP